MRYSTETPLLGKVFGSKQQLSVVGSIKNKGRVKYVVKCSICKDDAELYGDGLFCTDLQSLRKGTLPCGCSTVKKYTHDQLIILINRECVNKNYKFLGFAEEWNGRETRLMLECMHDGNVWKTTRISNFLLGIGCRVCFGKRLTDKASKPDSYYIEKFKRNVKFRDFEFWRSERGGRHHQTYWKYKCPICSIDERVKDGLCSGVFESAASGLYRGATACRCGSAGGFNQKKDAVIYVYEIGGRHNDFIGYGISTNYFMRRKTHYRNLKKHGLRVISLKLFPTSGIVARQIEGLIKQNFKHLQLDVVGFKVENTSSENLSKLLTFISKSIPPYMPGEDTKGAWKYLVERCSGKDDDKSKAILNMDKHMKVLQKTEQLWKEQQNGK